MIFLCNVISPSRNSTRKQRLSLLSRHFRTTLVCKIHPPPRQLESVEVRCLGTGPLSWLQFLWLAKRLRARHQILHTSPELYGVFFGWLSKKLFGYLWVYDLWDHPSLEFSLGRKPRHWFKRFIYDRFLSRMLSQADLWIVAMHEDVLDTLPPPSKSTEVLQVTNGVERAVNRLSSAVEHRWPREADRLRLTYSGWVLLQRGIAILLDFLVIEAASSCWNGVRLEVRLLGKTDATTLEAIEAHNEKSSNRIEYLGFLCHNRSLQEIHSSDICVCLLDSSVLNYNYAYPIKVLEYLGHGCIVVASKTLGISEFIEDGKNGFLMDGYSAQELLRTMFRIREAYIEGRIPAIRREAKRTARRFDWQNINAKIVGKLAALAS